MTDLIIPLEEIRRRCKLASEAFTQPERLHKSEPPQAVILISRGRDIRSYYVMEGYTDNCIFLDIRELFRKFRKWERITLTAPILNELVQVGAELARFCLGSRYDLAIDLSGTNDENMNVTINSLSQLGYQTSKVKFSIQNNPYTDVNPDDFGDLLPPARWEQIHVDWIYQGALSVILSQQGSAPTKLAPIS